MSLIRNMAGLVVTARRLGPCHLVVPAAEADTSLGATIEAVQAGLVHATLVGDRAGLLRRIEKLGGKPSDYEIIDQADDVAAARAAVERVRAGKADLILKGRLKTGDLMRAVLDKETGLRAGQLLSDVMVAEDPFLGGRLIGITDGGLNVAPSLQQKKSIIENAVHTFRRLGVSRPKVACLCAIEVVQDSMPHTLDARALTEMNLKGEIADCDVFGPLALDNALSLEAAKAKGVDHPVAGRADILLMPTIEAGNALGKALTFFAKCVVGHVVNGARAPVLIPSRVESARDKLCSIAIGALSVHADRAGAAWPTPEMQRATADLTDESVKKAMTELHIPW
jgi:phosphate butyryltransferase